MKLQGFIGPAYQLNSANVDAQRCVNLYPEVIESGNGKGGQVAYLKKTPGLDDLFTLGDGPIRLIHAENFERDNPVEKNIVYVFSGYKVFACSYVNGSWQTKEITRSNGAPGYNSELDSNVGPISAHSVKVSSTSYKTFFVDGYNNFIIESTNYDGGGTVYSPLAAFAFPPVLGATQVSWIDGYLILIQKNSNQFYVSEWNGTAFDPLNFATAEGNPDNIVAQIALNRDLWLFNTQSTEIFTNTGNPDFPFERVQSGFIEQGCSAAFSVAKTAGVVFWLSRDESGSGMVMAAGGPTPQRISTHAIEQAISTYSDISTARGYTYQKDGHSFYVLNFSEATWVYDLTTKLWHERAYLNDGILERHRGDTHAFLPNLGIHLIGDYQNNKVYELKESIKTDSGQEIKRLRSCPHISNEILGRIFHTSLQVGMETGIGLDGSAQGSDPKIMLRFSDDGGHTWSNEKQAAIGKLGNYKTRAIWRRLGQSRDRVYEVSVSDPIDVTFIDAIIDAQGGGN